MPREMIRNCDGGPYQAKVGWMSGGHLQLGVEGDDGRSLFWLLLGYDGDAIARIGRAVSGLIRPDWAVDEGPEAFGRKVLDLLDATSGTQELGETAPAGVLGPTGTYSGVWATLDREGCNHLIRVLRRARDSAFGRDE